MRVLVVGGSGHVGRLVLPLLAQNHTLRVFDLRPPHESSLEYVQGNACDYAAVEQAAQGMDALLYMAMGRYVRVGLPYNQNIDGVTSSLDANVKGLYIALQAAHSAGISHAVYTSSMSIYQEATLPTRYFQDEEMTPDATDLYGFTKRLGEEICRNTCRERGMTINVLRLCWPVSKERWLAETRIGVPTFATADEDLARALHAALERRFVGFQAFMISGDYSQKYMNMSKAKRLLDWEPLLRPTLAAE
jgi:nucleoside-diphosphate-sugar epimerase